MMRRRVGRPGLVGTMARTAVVAGTATAVSGGMMRHANNKANQQAEAEAYEQQQQQQQYEQQAAAQPAAAQQAPAAAAPAPAASVDIVSEIKKLGDLKAAGLLTDEEFAAAKAKLLA